MQMYSYMYLFTDHGDLTERLSLNLEVEKSTLLHALGDDIMPLFEMDTVLTRGQSGGILTA